MDNVGVTNDINMHRSEVGKKRSGKGVAKRVREEEPAPSSKEHPTR